MAIMDTIQQIDYMERMQAYNLCKFLTNEVIIYITNIFENAIIKSEIEGYGYYLHTSEFGYDIKIFRTDFKKEKANIYDYIYSIKINVNGSGIIKIKVELFIDGISDTFLLDVNNSEKANLKQVTKAIDKLVSKVKAKYKLT
jgi:hypothetical protein